MAALEITRHLRIVGDDFALGSKTAPLSVTVVGTKYDIEASVPDNHGEVVLWDGAGEGDGGITSWTVAVIESDKAVFVQLTGDSPAERVVFKVSSASPLILTEDDIAGDGAADVFPGDGVAMVDATHFGQAVKIVVKNPLAAGGGSALVRLTLFP